MKRKMKIKLIAPHEQRSNSISSAETYKIQKLSLALLAALTPAEHEVTIVDEAFHPDDLTEEVDLVGITVMTELASRAYRIADRYRRLGVKVVLGGIHPTVLPGEAIKHADAVVIGEAELVWPKLLSHLASGKMLRFYYAGKPTELRGMPHAKHELYPGSAQKGYTPVATTIETSRGCVFDCEFCSISQVMGRIYRTRPVREVIEEIDSNDSPNLFFVDDSIALNREEAKKLFSDMIPRRRHWVGQGTIRLSENTGLLRLMKRSGCQGLLIGFESVQQEIHREMRKLKNMRIDFAESMRRFHGEGIAILGAFIFGFDHESRDVFDQTLEFLLRYRVDCVQLRILTPFPGTRFYRRLLDEGRLFVHDWWLHGYSSDHLLFQPKNMSPEELFEGFARMIRHACSFSSIARRFFGMSPWKRSILGCHIYAGYNFATRNRYLKSLQTPQPFAFASHDLHGSICKHCSRSLSGGEGSPSRDL